MSIWILSARDIKVSAKKYIDIGHKSISKTFKMIIAFTDKSHRFNIPFRRSDMLKFYISLASAIFFLMNINHVYAAGLLRVTECTNPKGAFYDLRSNDKKWNYNDSIKMSITVLTEHDGAHDIVIRDSVGESTIKHSSRGYYFMPRSEKRFTVLFDTLPLGIFEIFQLEYNDNNTASLIYTIMKNGTPPHNATQVSTYVLSCNY